MAQISSNKCDTCPDRIGSSFCKECQEYLCEQCRTFHDKFTKGEHTVTDSQGVSKSVLKSKLFCEDHKMIFLHFCDNCKCLTCSKCTTSGHKGHLFTDIAEKANETREVLLETCKTLREKSSALSDVIKQINKLQLPNIQDSTERFKTVAQATYNDCKTMVNEVVEIRMNRANDYRVLELEHARFTLAKLQKQHDECTTECSKIEQFLQEKHLTFYVQQRDLAQNVDAMDEIPKIDEPNEIGTFDKDEFLNDVVEKFQSKYSIRLLRDKEDTLEQLKRELVEEKNTASKQKEMSDTEITTVRKEMEMLSQSLEAEKVKLSEMEADMTLHVKLLREKEDTLEKLKIEFVKEKNTSSKQKEISETEITTVRQDMEILCQSLETEKVKLSEMEADTALHVKQMRDKDGKLDRLKREVNEEKKKASKQKEISDADIATVCQKMELDSQSLKAEKMKVSEMESDMALHVNSLKIKERELKDLTLRINEEKNKATKEKEENREIVKRLHQELGDLKLEQETENIKNTMFPEETIWDSSISKVSQVTRNICVAGIEIGTFSSCAYSVKPDDLTNLFSIVWKGHHTVNSRTPTAVLFDSNGEFSHFGYDAEEHHLSLIKRHEHENWYFFKDFKLMISRSTNSRKVMKTYDGKKELPALHVYSSVIKYLKDHLVNAAKLNSIHPARDIMWVITFPSIANCRAHDFMFQAATEAGIDRDKLLILSEPEANVAYCQQLSRCGKDTSGSWSETNQPGSKFLMVDCGSCSLDITAFEVGSDKSLHGLLNASFKGTCFKDVIEAFKEMFEKQFGSNVFLNFCKESDEANCFTDELRNTLTYHSPTERVSVKIRIPIAVLDLISQTPGAKSDGSMKINRKGVLTLSNEMVEELVAVPTHNVITRVEYILRKPGLQDVKNIIFTGGFVELPTLQIKLRNAFTNNNVTILPDAGLSVLKGAVIFGCNVACGKSD